jgi:hypothetical protein
MAIINDPTDLDRLQVLVDYVNETIGIKPINSTSPKVALEIVGEQNGQTQGLFAYPVQFKDHTALFSTSGVVSGDILTIVNGQDINHHTITGLVGETGLLVSAAFNSGESGVGYAVSAAAGGTVVDGATLQAVYSFLKEEWKTQGAGHVDLIQFVFPLESITREQFEIGGASHNDWDWRDNDTRNLIRTGGWAALDNAGSTLTEYAGIITLGSLDTDAQVYYLQVDSTSGTPTQPANFVLTGPVNQAVLTRDVGGGDDFRTFLKLFVRKKGKSYAESEISDIGVTSLETLVNRFPVSHIDDPAIVATDGQLAGGTAVYQNVTQNSAATGTDGVVASASTGTAQENTFGFSSATATFQTNNVQVHDVVILSGTASGLDDKYYEVVSVDSETDLTLLQEPNINIPTESSITYGVNSRLRAAELSDGSIAYVDVAALSGTLTSALSDFVSSGVAAGDKLGVLATGTDSSNEFIGVYDVLSITDLNNVVVDTKDQPWPAAGSGSINFEIYQPGMHLQYLKELATNVAADATSGLVFTAGGPDQIQRRDGGSFYTDAYVTGGVVRVGNAEDTANVGAYVVSGITTTTTADDTVQLVSTNGITTNAADTLATLSGENGFVRPLQGINYSWNWRMFANDGTLSESFQWVQKQLRRGFATNLDDGDFRGVADIDFASGVFRGDITDLLMSFASPNATTFNLYIDELNATEKNNVSFEDVLGISRNFAFISTLSISINTNLIDDADVKVVVFFTNDDAGDDTGRDFGTDTAIIVQDTTDTNMTTLNPSSSPISYEFDYDGNTQRGTASAATDAPVTIVAIGLNTAQYVSTAGTVTRQSVNVFSLVSALERNYSNP